MSGQLPKGWVSALLSQAAEINPRHPKGIDDTMLVSFAPMAGLSESKPSFQFTEERPLGQVRKSFTHFAEGDVLFAKITPCMENGKGAVARGLRNKLGCGTTELHVIRPLGAISPEYIYWFLAQEKVRRAAKENFTGTAGQARVPTSFIADIQIPLAPLPEQRRIVAKLETLLAKVDSCQQRLAKIPLLLKRFRQSVLAAACSGRLTADWREMSDTDPMAASGKKLPPHTVKPVPEEADLPELPECWYWVQFRSVLTELRNGVPLRPNMGPPGVPILRISATRPGKVDLGDLRYLPQGADFLPQYALHDGDLLFTRYNGSIELLGVCGLVRGLGKKTLLYPDKLMRARFDISVTLPPYVEIFFSAPDVHERLVSRSKSSAGQNGVSGTDLKAQPFALPPLPEQQEIVRRVESLFALADQIEARYTKAQQQVDKLTPSLLAKAFRGDLVPQDPNDEPASKLLERIRAANPKPESSRRAIRTA